MLSMIPNQPIWKCPNPTYPKHEALAGARVSPMRKIDFLDEAYRCERTTFDFSLLRLIDLAHHQP
jgi:hypothetical protein